jgi:EAL domain-containing protein (putative c-di-GMP-specific phosphodiesterase class I)
MLKPETSVEADHDRLQAEWLRFRAHVVDGATGLPTLAAVLDDVRRLTEERGTAGLVYLDLARPEGGVAPEGQAPSDPVLQMAHALVSLKADGGLGPRDIVALLSVRSDKFLVFLRGGESTGGDLGGGEARLHRLREQVQGALRQLYPPPQPLPVFRLGHSLLFRDPMLRTERSLHRALDEAMFQTLRERTAETERRSQGLEEILAGGVVTLFQPIVDLGGRHAVGHEVFSRGPAGGPFEDGERLFALASRFGRLLELERLCRRRSLRSAFRHLRPGVKLFLNTSVRALLDESVAGDAFIRQVDAQGLAHPDVVLEITGGFSMEERRRYQRVVRRLKQEGFKVAIDDTGAGYASLQALVEMEPDYLKFDVSLVRPLAHNRIQRSLLETLVELSAKIGAQVIAAGIESEAELIAVRGLGVPLGQGRHLAPPVLIPMEDPSTR